VNEVLSPDSPIASALGELTGRLMQPSIPQNSGEELPEVEK